MKEFMSKFNNPWYGLQELEVLSGPENFYSTIMKLLSEASHVYIVTLYIGGNDQRSHDLFQLLSQRKEKKLYTKIILDKNRGSEERTMSFIRQHAIEELFIFRDVIPVPLPGIIKQIIRVLHEKVYIFDDNVILSGANLGGRYFGNIRDRYYRVKSSELSSYLVFRYFGEFVPYDKIVSETKCCIIQDEKHALEMIYDYFENPIIATPYPNIPGSYKKLLEGHTLVVAAPECNTFDDRPLVRSITSIIINKLRTVFNVKFYRKEGVLCHIKGVWAFSDFVVTIIGSSNYNIRSSFRDTELNFLIVSREQKVIQSIKNEIEGIMRDTVDNVDLTVTHPILGWLVYLIFGRFI